MITDKMELYFYNGMREPELVDMNNFRIESNTLGDLTDNLKADYKDMIENYTLEEIQENQLLYKYDIWINPSREMLEGYNKSKMLPKGKYLDDFR